MKKKTFHFGWIFKIFVQPRQTFQLIAAGGSSWLTPMLVFTIASLLSIFAAGWLQGQAAATGVIPTPPDFEYWSAEQQTQYMQSYSASQGPTFLYGLPALSSLMRIWLGWLVIGGLLHLIITLIGGSGGTSASMHIVAWSNIPLALRELIRAGYMILAQKAIQNTGLSGFIDTAAGGSSLFWAALLSLIDIYLIWQYILLIIGARTVAGIPSTKAVIGISITMAIVILSLALVGYGFGSLSGLSISRPFFF